MYEGATNLTQDGSGYLGGQVAKRNPRERCPILDLSHTGPWPFHDTAIVCARTQYYRLCIVTSMSSVFSFIDYDTLKDTLIQPHTLFPNNEDCPHTSTQWWSLRNTHSLHQINPIHPIGNTLTLYQPMTHRCVMTFLISP